MLQTTLQILPLILLFLTGFGLKKARFLKVDDGGTLLKLIFYVGAPALIFLSIIKVQLNTSLLLMCLIAPCIVGLTLIFSSLLRRSILRKISPKTYGVIIIGASIMNLGFMLPFVEKLYGAEGVARLAVIDVTNGILTFSLLYAIAASLGNEKPNTSFILKKLLISPPLWAVILALVYKSIGAVPPTIVSDTLGLAAQLVAPVILIALGLKFTPRIKRPKLLVFPILLRFGLGFAVGILFIKTLGLTGLNAQIVLLAAIAPIGFNSITFAELEDLDTEFAASQVSIALLFSIITLPLTVHLLNYL